MYFLLKCRQDITGASPNGDRDIASYFAAFRASFNFQSVVDYYIVISLMCGWYKTFEESPLLREAARDEFTV